MGNGNEWNQRGQKGGCGAPVPLHHVSEDRRRGENLTLKRRSGKRDSREKVKDIEKSEGLLY